MQGAVVCGLALVSDPSSTGSYSAQYGPLQGGALQAALLFALQRHRLSGK